jgi:cation:H+ antiporter
VVLTNILLFIVGLTLLVKGADIFVEAASLIAGRFGVSEFIIGLTLVSIGTSIPELASSLTAVFQHSSGIVIGNVLGSNIANIGLIAGVAALISNVRTDELMLRRDGYIMLFSSVLLFLFMLDSEISRIEAFIFLLLYLAYLLFLLDKVKRPGEEVYFKDFLVYLLTAEFFFDLKEKTRPAFYRNKKRDGKLRPGEDSLGSLEEQVLDGKLITKRKEPENAEVSIELINMDIPDVNPSESSLSMEFFKLVASGIAIIVGAHFFVEEAIFFAQFLEVPETLIGFSLVAVGTSVPEFMVTITAARKNYSGIALGNVIGSNLTNILLILGCSGIIEPLTITGLTRNYIAPFMLVITVLFLVFIRTDWRIKKFEGLILFLLYSGFMLFILRLG